METLYPHCAGLDVHKKTVVACRRIVLKGRVHEEVRSFETATRGLLELSDWLQEADCTIVAMEATGSYWKPVWHVLEGNFELVLANAAHIRNVPGRKSDVNDAMWIAQLLAHGLIRSSFVPPGPIQDLRDLTRTRKQLVREVVQHTQRIQKVLEDCNIKLSSVISDVLGVSGRAILEALIAGESDPKQLAALGSQRLKCSREQLEEALHGRARDHHRFLMTQHLRMIDSLEDAIRQIEAQIEAVVQPFRAACELLVTIPGVKGTSAQAILGEIGIDMSRFPSAGHLLSWSTICPRMDESAGKRRSTRMRKGGNWLKPVLIQCAWAASREKGTYLQAQYLRLRSRRGPKKAIGAVAASILTAAYYMLRDGVPYRDLGPDHFVRHGQDRDRVARRLTRRLEEMGYQVQIQKAA
jgi:transposase